MEFYNFILTWVMLARTTLEEKDRFLGSVGVVMRDRGPLVTNQMNPMGSQLCDSHAGYCPSDVFQKEMPKWRSFVKKKKTSHILYTK